MGVVGGLGQADLAGQAGQHFSIDQPRPEGTTPYGSPDLRRMHVGRYWVLYEITDATVTIVVIHLGRIG